MNNNELNTEKIILDAAEEEFLTKGFGNAKMMGIAKRAGVSHSMLHYYFRSKENLFQIIFRNKVQAISQLFIDIFDKELPFEQTMRLLVETQFDFVAQNVRLPRFILNEIMTNKENRDLLIEVLMPKFSVIFMKMTTFFNNEIEKGTIRPISLLNLMMNVLSMNVASFVALPVLEELVNNGNSVEELLRERRESNVQFILNAMKRS